MIKNDAPTTQSHKRLFFSTKFEGARRDAIGARDGLLSRRRDSVDQFPLCEGLHNDIHLLPLAALAK